MQAAVEFVKEHKYYLAADAYTLASVYDDTSAAALAGRAHCLFVVGEYMSSSFYLKKALTISPEYANKQIDLGDLLGDKDLVDSRFHDLMKWQQLSKSPELAFLLAYVLYNVDRPDTALKFIDIAAEKMSDSPAVMILKRVIEARAAR